MKYACMNVWSLSILQARPRPGTELKVRGAHAERQVMNFVWPSCKETGVRSLKLEMLMSYTAT